MQKKRVRRSRGAASNKERGSISVTGRKNELIGVGLTTLGVVFICGIFGLNVGFVGVYLAKFLQYFFGIGAIFPAVFMIYLGYHYIMEGQGLSLTKQTGGIFMMLVTVLAVFHHFMVPVGEEILPSNLLDGGGLLGGIVLLILRKLFGATGGIVILVAGVIGSVLLTTSWSLANGIFTTKKQVAKGAVVAKETASVVYEKAKVVEAKVQENVVAQANNIQEKITTIHDNWQAKRQSTFFDQADVDYPDKAEGPVDAGDAYKGSLSEGIGKDNDDNTSDGKGIGERSKTNTLTKGFTVDVAGAMLDENGNPRKDNVWGINSNPGERLANMMQNPVSDEKLSEAIPESEAADDTTEEEAGNIGDNLEITQHDENDAKPAAEVLTESIAAQETMEEEVSERISEHAMEVMEESEQEEIIDAVDNIFQLNISNDDFDKVSDAVPDDDVAEEEADILEYENMDDDNLLDPYDDSVVQMSELSDEVFDDEVISDEIVDDSDVEEDMEKGIDGEAEEEIPYIMPDVHELLDTVEKADMGAVREEIEEKAKILAQTLQDFNVKATIMTASRGPAVTQYEVKPAPGVKVNKITNLSDEIALNMAAPAVRIELIPGKTAIGIEVPNTIRDSVPLREVLEQPEFPKADSKLTVGLGKDIAGRAVFADLAKMPHLMVAGATGSGKSVCINTLICSVLFKAHPDEVKFILVDPKMVELSVYNDIPHLMVPVVTDAKKAASVLNWSVQEMERRYEQLKDAGVRNMDGYNKLYEGEPEKKMCSIVIIIDELADLMMVAPHDVEDAICRIAQKARAAGIYLVLATQRPSVNVITGTIKANIPSRISFAVTSQVDSRTILDASGAEKLLGRGDMLFSPVGAMKPTRIQGAFISDAEVERLLDFIRSQGHKVEANQEIIEFTERAEQEVKSSGNATDSDNGQKKTKRRNKSDILMGEALELILSSGQASTSNVQRRFRIGFATARNIIDNFEEMGILGPLVDNSPREILVSGDEARAILQEWYED